MRERVEQFYMTFASNR